MDELLDFSPERVFFALRGGRWRYMKIELLLSGSSDVREEVGEV